MREVGGEEDMGMGVRGGNTAGDENREINRKNRREIGEYREGRGKGQRD